MDARSFLKNFGYIANAPDGVKQLRYMIYYIGITGLLCSQDALEGDGATLLKTINQEKRRRIEQGRFKRTLKFEKLKNTYAAFLPKIPNSWVWTRLVDIGEISPKNNYEDDTMASFLSMSKISEKHKIRLLPEDRLWGIIKKGYTHFANGDVAVAKITPCFENGKASIIRDLTNGIGAGTTELHVVRPLPGIDPFFIYLFLRSPYFKVDGVQYMTGTAGQKRLPTEYFATRPFPLPPTTEQKRIVAKVDELMALCDKLEGQQQERQRLFPALSRTTHTRLVESTTPANIQAIFNETETVSPDDLRKTIFSLAVRGKLVDRIPEEGTSQDMLKEMSVKPAQPSGAPTIPQHWSWVTLGSVIEDMNSGWSPACLRHPAGLDEWGVLKTTAVQTLEYQEDQNKQLPPSLEPRPKNAVSDGDILITRAGPKNRVGILCVARPTRTKLMISDKIIRFHLTSFIQPEYAALALNADFSNACIDKLKSGMAESQMNISQPKLRTVPLPLPPKNEQLRILRKVDELMIRITHLEKQQNKKIKIAKSFSQSAIVSITGNQREKSSFSLEGILPMKKTRKNQGKSNANEKPLLVSIKKISLRKFAMDSGYRSLQNFDCSYHSTTERPAEVSPICLVGLNGSGKSNLIEAIAEVFCFLELINLPWEKVKSPSSRYRKNRHRFELEYTIEDSSGEKLVRVRKTKLAGVDFFLVDDEGTEVPVKKGRDQLSLLPRRIIGYSSGLNETVSHPFLRTRTMYSEEVRDAAPPLGRDISSSSPVFDTKTLYMDYESNAAILICNYIFHSDSDLAFFDEYTRVRGVASFGLKFNRKIAGKAKPNNIVRLTNELVLYLESFARCAGETFDIDQETYIFNFHLDKETKELFRKEFDTAERLFLAMHKWSLLNALVLSNAQRKVFLKEDITNGTLERPPVVPPANRIFNIMDVKIFLSAPEIEIDYSGLSDGEHQFMQVFGTVLLFNEPGTLFLFDEPESHFNPEWRTKFNLILNDLPNAKSHEYVISTHSPFVISGSRGSNVYKFEREGAKVQCKPIKFETYGASFNFLLKKLFSIHSMIDKNVRNKLEAIIKRGDVEEMEEAVGDFAESLEKRRLYEALIKKESGQE